MRPFEIQEPNPDARKLADLIMENCSEFLYMEAFIQFSPLMIGEKYKTSNLQDAIRSGKEIMITGPEKYLMVETHFCGNHILPILKKEVKR